jgi:hypothetical protein
LCIMEGFWCQHTLWFISLPSWKGKSKYSWHKNLLTLVISSFKCNGQHALLNAASHQCSVQAQWMLMANWTRISCNSILCLVNLCGQLTDKTNVITSGWLNLFVLSKPATQSGNRLFSLHIFKTKYWRE